MWYLKKTQEAHWASGILRKLRNHDLSSPIICSIRSILVRHRKAQRIITSNTMPNRLHIDNCLDLCRPVQKFILLSPESRSQGALFRNQFASVNIPLPLRGRSLRKRICELKRKNGKNSSLVVSGCVVLGSQPIKIIQERLVVNWVFSILSSPKSSTWWQNYTKRKRYFISRRSSSYFNSVNIHRGRQEYTNHSRHCK